MARGINKVIIVGNLGQDPETTTFPDGGSITNISVATSEAWTDKQTGQPQERTEWHKIVFRGRLAEIATQYLRKGSKVYIEGSLRTTKYQDKQTGADRCSTEIMAREMQMLDTRGQSEGGQGGQSEPQTPQSPSKADNTIKPEIIMTPKAAGFSLQSYKDQGWALQGLVDEGFVELRQRAAPAQPAPPKPAPPKPATPPPPKPVSQAAPANSFDDFDDDIPF